MTDRQWARAWYWPLFTRIAIYAELAGLHPQSAIVCQQAGVLSASLLFLGLPPDKAHELYSHMFIRRC